MVFYMADPHFGHEKLVNKIMGMDAQEWSGKLIEDINSVVGRKDRLYILGDVGVRPEFYRPQITCKDVRLIMGNHDHDLNKKCLQVFKYVHENRLIKLGEGYVWLSHYPHAYWPKSHKGSFHLYGHIHGRYEEILDRALPGRRAMDVSPWNRMRLDGQRTPFSEHEILALLGARPGSEEQFV
jgi:calcineurin-like phosphoesterase family protein